MSRVRVLAGTRKGAFILISDGKRKNWKVFGPHFAGWEIYHMKGSPVDQNRIYASQTSAWFGQIIQRSDDGGESWNTPGGGPATNPEGIPMGESNKFVYNGVPGTHQWYDGTQHPWEFKRVWHLEPSLDDPNHVYAGVEDAALFQSKTAVRHGRSYRDCANTIPDRSGSRAQAECVCTRFSSIKRIQDEYPSQSPPRAPFVVMTAAKRGSQSIEVYTRNSCPIQRQR